MISKLNKMLWAIGLMSGTSADGIDAALLETDGLTIKTFGPSHFIPYPTAVKNQVLHAYGHPPGPEIKSLERTITELHAEVVFALLGKARLQSSDVDLIGFHGQTLFHKPPQKKGEIGKTYIIGDGQFLASLTGLPVVDQFRLNDIAHGGQGAPFVPIFHQALAQKLPKPLGILNIGGVANLTWIGESEDKLLAFDAGPGNGLIDDWIRKNTALQWDEGGVIAAKGSVNENLLLKWLSHPYFKKAPPKSLDRSTFNACLADLGYLPFEEAIATLTAFAAASFGKALEYLPSPPLLWLVAGGGAHNLTLLHMIKERIKMPILKAADKGWDSDALEAQAFAFLAVRSAKNLPLSFPGTTGVPYPLTGGRLSLPKTQ